MPRKHHPPTPKMLAMLNLIDADTKWRARELDKLRRTRPLARGPVGYVAMGDRTLYALEKRKLVEKKPNPGSGLTLVWTLTPAGREALDAAR